MICFEKELLNVQSLLAPLREKNLITQYEEENLAKSVEADWNSDTEKAKERFLRILKSKGPDAFVIFLNVLRNEKEHIGHKSLYSKLVQHMDKKLPSRSEPRSEPVDMTEKLEEKLIFNSPVARHKSFKARASIESVTEEGQEPRLEQIGKSLQQGFQSLEKKIDSLALQISRQKDASYVAAANKPQERRTSEIAGLPSLQSVTHIQASSFIHT